MAADFLAAATSFTVADASQISPGLIEVEQELMWCTSVDTDANVVYVSGRGIYGSGAADHSAGAFARNDPKYPRSAIVKAINSTLLSSYPDLFGVSTTTLTAVAAEVEYGIPAEAEEILDVSWQTVGPSEYWSPVRRWRLNNLVNTGAFATGRSISIFDPMLPGRTIQVVYRKVPTKLSSLSDDFSTTTGLNESAVECIVFGACSRLVGYLQPSSMSNDSAEARLLENANRMSSGATFMDAGRYYYTMYLQARQEEARRLLDRYPARMHFTR